MSVNIKKGYIIAGTIVALIVGVYLAIPYFVLKNVNKILANMEGYRGHIDKFQLNILQVGFSVGGFKIEKLEGDIPVPFIYVDEISNILEWRPLLKGKILGRTILENPKVNFVKGPTKAQTQTGAEGNWIKTVADLPNFTINSVTVNNGKISYFDSYSKPKVEVFINEMNAEITNLRNVYEKGDKLPSHLHLTGNSIGKGQLEVTADMNILKEVPDFNVDFKFRKVNLTALRDFTKAYAKFDFEEGQFSLFMEAALYNSHLKGYVQPLLENIKVLDLKKDKDETWLQHVWSGLVGTTLKVTENSPKERFATRIPFEGDLKDVKVEIWPTIFNIFKNKFVEAYPKAIDNSIDINSTNKKK